LLRLYLDSSTIVKRYITEPGTRTTDSVFDKAEAGELAITLSIWNLGEVFGVLDERRRRGWLSEDEFARTLRALSNELIKLKRLRVLEVAPIHTSILTEAWSVILSQHIYEADAIQITSCRYTQSDALLSSDENLVEASRRLGLEAYDTAKEEQEFREFLESKRTAPP